MRAVMTLSLRRRPTLPGSLTVLAGICPDVISGSALGIDCCLLFRMACSPAISVHKYTLFVMKSIEENKVGDECQMSYL